MNLLRKSTKLFSYATAKLNISPLLHSTVLFRVAKPRQKLTILHG